MYSLKRISDEGNDPPFLQVKKGDHVLVDELINTKYNSNTSWWIGQIIYCYEGARPHSKNSLFQIINIDTGKIEFINGDEVKEIIKKSLCVTE